jgi:pSer/pThr/pTyr-binding forkhead associated (FHA) protein
MSGVVVLIVRILLTAALYCFLAFVLISIWTDIRKKIRERDLVSKVLVTFIPSRSGKPAIQINDDRIIIGRGSTCQVRSSHRSVSASHANVSFHDNQWWVEDLHSRNGTFVNDLKVSAPTVLASHDHLRCGSVEWEIQLN